MKEKTKSEELIRYLEELNISYSEEALSKLERFYELTIEKNKVMNLTAITEREEFMRKHFADSLALLKFHDIKPKDRVLDLGTGGGFPGIPLKIFRPETEFLLVDSVNKKLTFINEVIDELKLSGIATVHGRAEDLARDKAYREKYDLVVSRAVANLSTLTELSLGFVKPGGRFISYKGASGEEELKEADNAIRHMGGSIEKVQTCTLPGGDDVRQFIFIRKDKSTSDKYPRKAGIPGKDPL